MTKLNRSETVTVRLDARLNYLTELAGRCQRRTKSSFIEWAVQQAVRSMPRPMLAEDIGLNRDSDRDPEGDETQSGSVGEADRARADRHRPNPVSRTTP